jgi:hypothetical protein
MRLKGLAMKSLQHCIDQINHLLSELIQVATQLRDMSFQVISEEDLTSLQKHQEDLLGKLEEADRFIQKNYRNQIKPEVQENFHQQLQTFQQLNQEFIQNINTNQGLIQFELHHLQEEGRGFSSREKKTPPSPIRSIESQEK